MPTIYVIMPITSDPLASQKRRVIADVAAKFNLRAHFPHYDSSAVQFDLKATVDDLKLANFVLADLSLERPSCYYELGLSEALGKKVYIVAQQGTDIHQTAYRKEVKYYLDLITFQHVVEGIFTHGYSPLSPGPNVLF